MKKYFIVFIAFLVVVTGCSLTKTSDSKEGTPVSNITSNNTSNSVDSSNKKAAEEAAKKKAAEEAAKKKAAEEAAKKKAAEEAAKKKAAAEAAKKKAAAEAAKKKAAEDAAKKKAAEEAKRKAAVTIMLKDGVKYTPGTESFECFETENCITTSLVNKIKTYKGFNVVTYNSNEITIKFIERLSGKYNNSTYLDNYETVKKTIISAGTVNTVANVRESYDLTKSVCNEYHLTCE